MNLTGVTWRIRDHIQFTVIDNEAIIIDTNNGLYLGLNEVGTQILQAISKTGNVKEVIESLLKEYQVSEEELQRDVTNFIEEFRAKGIIEIKG